MHKSPVTIATHILPPQDNACNRPKQLLSSFQEVLMCVPAVSYFVLSSILAAGPFKVSELCRNDAYRVSNEQQDICRNAVSRDILMEVFLKNCKTDVWEKAHISCAASMQYIETYFLFNPEDRDKKEKCK
jgi:hypothetical protein